MPEGTVLNFSDTLTKRRFLTECGALDGPYRVVLKRWRPGRSNRANAFYWAAVVPALQQFLAAQGQHLDAEQVHELYKEKFLRVEVINQNTGEVIGWTTGSTAKLDVEQFSAYLERIIEWLADMLGIVVQPILELAAERKAG